MLRRISCIGDEPEVIQPPPEDLRRQAEGDPRCQALRKGVRHGPISSKLAAAPTVVHRRERRLPGRR